MKKKEIAEKLEETISWVQLETDSLRSAMESAEIEIRDNNATVWKYIHDAIEPKLNEIIERMDRIEKEFASNEQEDDVSIRDVVQHIISGGWARRKAWPADDYIFKNRGRIQSRSGGNYTLQDVDMIADDWMLFDDPEDVKMRLEDIEEDQEDTTEHEECRASNLTYDAVVTLLETCGGIAWRKEWEKHKDYIKIKSEPSGITILDGRSFSPIEENRIANDWKWRKD